jgi:uncharacterized membrane protein YjfL (UPF0719 family)
MSYLLLAAGIAFWTPWYWRLVTVNRIGSPIGPRLLLASMPAACAVMLWEVLVNFGATDVRDNPPYLFLYLMLGALWIGIVMGIPSFLGLSTRDDVLERRNPAAAYAIAGALLGFTLAFAGGNVGDGPGVEAVVDSAFLSTVGLLALWAVAERLTHFSELITVDRDVAAGLRLAGFLVSEGLVLGRAVAGDWVSQLATLRDFGVYALPTVVPLGLVAVLNKYCQPGREQSASPVLLCGVLPCLVLVGCAAVWLMLVGAPK